MTDKLIARIPLNSIGRIELYDNSKNRYSINKIKSLTGCTYAINAGLFNMSTYKHYCNMKSNGTVLNKENYTEYGFAWNNGSDIALTVLPSSSHNNYIGCVCLLRNGNKEQMYVNSELQGKRGRTAIGIDNNSNLVLYVSKDGTSSSSTPTNLQTEMLNLDCKDALMLDGGGSSQCIFNGNAIEAERKVSSLILVYTNSTNIETISKTTTFVQKFKEWIKSKFDYDLDISSGYNEDTQYIITRCVQEILNESYKCKLDVDGFFGEKCKALYPANDMIRGAKGNLVYILQGLLYMKGYNPNGFDGSYGNGMKSAITLFQSSNSLLATGNCNLSTFLLLKD